METKSPQAIQPGIHSSNNKEILHQAGKKNKTNTQGCPDVHMSTTAHMEQHSHTPYKINTETLLLSSVKLVKTSESGQIIYRQGCEEADTLICC